MPTKEELGRRLRAARFERNMTLKEVATRCGMSATHISEVERGKTSPTIGALQRIAGALGEKASYFVQEDELPRVRLTTVAKSREILVSDSKGDTFSVAVLSSGIPGGTAQAFRHRMKAGERFDAHPRIGEIVVHCIEGMFRLSVLGESEVLREGDTIQFRADEGYSVENIGEEESETVSFLAAPTLVVS